MTGRVSDVGAAGVKGSSLQHTRSPGMSAPLSGGSAGAHNSQQSKDVCKHSDLKTTSPVSGSDSLLMLGQPVPASESPNLLCQQNPSEDHSPQANKAEQCNAVHKPATAATAAPVRRQHDKKTAKADALNDAGCDDAAGSGKGRVTRLSGKGRKAGKAAIRTKKGNGSTAVQEAHANSEGSDEYDIGTLSSDDSDDDRDTDYKGKNAKNMQKRSSGQAAAAVAAKPMAANATGKAQPAAGSKAGARKQNSSAAVPNERKAPVGVSRAVRTSKLKVCKLTDPAQDQWVRTSSDQQACLLTGKHHIQPAHQRKSHVLLCCKPVYCFR